MNIPQLLISKTDIQMNYSITPAQQRISQPQAELNISQPNAIVDIEITNAQLDVDMSQFWRDVGLESTGENIREYAQKGRQAALSSISSTMSEGRQLMLNAGKGQKGQIIQSIAVQNHGPKPTRIGLDFIPSFGAVKVHIDPGTTDVNIMKQNPKIDVQVNKPIHEYTPGDVNGTMVVRPNVKIDVIG